MFERREAVRQPARAPLPRRSRKRWAVAAGIAVGWLVLLAVTGSVITATMLLVVIAGLGLAVVLGGLRALGVTTDHPRIQQIAARRGAMNRTNRSAMNGTSRLSITNEHSKP